MSSIEDVVKNFTLPSPKRNDKSWVAAIDESIRLAKPMLGKDAKKIRKYLLQSITENGRGLADLVPKITELTGNARDSERMARDLMCKAFQNHSKQKLLKIGLKRFEWLHSGGQSCPEHVTLSGHTYCFNEPPVIDPQTGQRGFPSDLFGCRCKILPVLEFDD